MRRASGGLPSAGYAAVHRDRACGTTGVRLAEKQTGAVHAARVPHEAVEGSGALTLWHAMQLWFASVGGGMFHFRQKGLIEGMCDNRPTRVDGRLGHGR